MQILLMLHTVKKMFQLTALPKNKISSGTQLPYVSSYTQNFSATAVPATKKWQALCATTV
jgi:hypothetical protein